MPISHHSDFHRVISSHGKLMAISRIGAKTKIQNSAHHVRREIFHNTSRKVKSIPMFARRHHFRPLGSSSRSESTTGSFNFEAKSLVSKYGLTAGLLSGCLVNVLACPANAINWKLCQAFCTSWGFVALTAPLALPYMKKFQQVFQEDGPEHTRKTGTPTVGGLLFVPAGLIFGLICSKTYENSAMKVGMFGVALLTTAYAAIGLLDDLLIIRMKSNKGLAPFAKLGLQLSFGALYCISISKDNYLILKTLPVLNCALNRILYGIISVAVIAGESNAVNITDGVDGLAAGLFSIATIGFAFVLLRTSPLHAALSIQCMAMSGASCGFLACNGHPAKVFMGDTGSLALGGFLAAVAIYTGSVVPFLFLSMVFNLELLSVIIQVAYFKWTKKRTGSGKRIFKMAPFHHHLELSNWGEHAIVAMFYSIAILFSIFSYPLTKILYGFFKLNYPIL